MISINSLIHSAFQRCSLVEEGGSPTPDQSNSGLRDLHSLISELNTQNSILENYQTFDTFCSERIKFAVKPDRWFEVSSIEDIQSRIDDGKCLIYDIFKVGRTFYVIHPSGSSLTYVTDEEWSRKMLELYWPQFFVDEVPDRVLGCARKMGEIFVQLYPASKTAIDSSRKSSSPLLYTAETEVLDIEFPHLQDDPNYCPFSVEYFVVEVDSTGSYDYRITVLKGIPKLDVRDVLPISSKYESMIEDGLCVKLCQRYALMDRKPDFEASFERAKRNIEHINMSNRPLTYSWVGNGSYRDPYLNLIEGNLW